MPFVFFGLGWGAPAGHPIRGTAFRLFDLVDGRISRYRLFLHAEFPEPVALDTTRLNTGSAPQCEAQAVRGGGLCRLPMPRRTIGYSKGVATLAMLQGSVRV